jgi:solute carrier family 44 protein 1 (choline transporter-like protein)/choline transporter-like protein 2/4/5
MGVSIPNLPSFSYYNIFGYIVFGIALLIFIIIICCCGRIRLAVALCGVAGQFIASTCQIVLVPLIMGFLVFALWVAAIIAMVCLIGTATFVVNGNSIFTSIQSYTTMSLGFFYYFVFGTLWVNALLLAITIFVVAAACAVWYFSRAPGINLDSPVCAGFWMAFRYHFGSLAFGALIIAIIQFIQFIFEIFVKNV